MPEIKESIFCLCVLLIAIVNNRRFDKFFCQEWADIVEIVEEVGMESLRGFYFVGFHLVCERTDDIYFVLALVPVERQEFFTPCIGAVLYKVVDHHVFEKVATQRVRIKLFDGVDAKQKGSKPCVVKV